MNRPRICGSVLTFIIGTLALSAAACVWSPRSLIEIDGSSTVYPITEAVTEEFHSFFPEMRVTVGISGTGGGFSRLVRGEVDIINASRPITDAERESAAKNGIQYLELKIALDGIAMVTHPSNTFVSCLTTQELKTIWEPESKVTYWSDVHPEWPHKPLGLYGPGTDSGTFDYFTKVINGEQGASRSDFTSSEDDNFLIYGIEGDKNSLGYLGYAYFIENRERLRLIKVDSGQGCVSPSIETIERGEYQPLSRPLFIYVNVASLKKKEVETFVRFYLEHAAVLVPQVGYVSLSTEAYQIELQKLSFVLWVLNVQEK